MNIFDLKFVGLQLLSIALMHESCNNLATLLEVPIHILTYDSFHLLILRDRYMSGNLTKLASSKMQWKFILSMHLEITCTQGTTGLLNLDQSDQMIIFKNSQKMSSTPKGSKIF